MDVRLKLLLLAGLLGLVLSHKGFIFPALVFALSASFILYLKVPPKKFLLRLSQPLLIAAVLVFIKSLSGKVPVLELSLFGLDFSLYREGLLEGAKLAVRLLAAVGAVSALSFSASFPEILSGLASLRVPKSLIEVSLFAGRFLKSFSEEARNIHSAQKNRLGYSGVKRSMNSIGILAGSLIIRAFDQAQATSTAMLQRGYQGGVHLYKKEALEKRDCLGAGLLFAFLLIAWIKLP